MTRKYAKVQIAGKGREYTYHCDDDIQPGDEVEFTLPSGHSMTGEVREVDLNQPAFPTKPAMKIASGRGSVPSSVSNDSDDIPF